MSGSSSRTTSVYIYPLASPDANPGKAVAAVNCIHVGVYGTHKCAIPKPKTPKNSTRDGEGVYLVHLDVRRSQTLGCELALVLRGLKCLEAAVGSGDGSGIAGVGLACLHHLICG